MTTAAASRPIISFLAASSRPHKPCQLCFDSFTLWGKASGKLGYYSSRERTKVLTSWSLPLLLQAHLFHQWIHKEDESCRTENKVWRTECCCCTFSSQYVFSQQQTTNNFSKQRLLLHKSLFWVLEKLLFFGKINNLVVKIDFLSTVLVLGTKVNQCNMFRQINWEKCFRMRTYCEALTQFFKWFLSMRRDKEVLTMIDSQEDPPGPL